MADWIKEELTLQGDHTWRAAEPFNPSSRWNTGPKTRPGPRRPGMMHSVRWNSGCISRIRPRVTRYIENPTHSFVRHLNRNPLAQLGASSLSNQTSNSHTASAGWQWS